MKVDLPLERGGAKRRLRNAAAAAAMGRRRRGRKRYVCCAVPENALMPSRMSNGHSAGAVDLIERSRATDQVGAELEHTDTGTRAAQVKSGPTMTQLRWSSTGARTGKQCDPPAYLSTLVANSQRNSPMNTYRESANRRLLRNDRKPRNGPTVDLFRISRARHNQLN